MILPKKILAMPKFGCWNVHASLLPRWRGAAPIQRAIAAGDAETGVCLMQMDAGLDTGPVYLRREIAIDPLDTGDSLTQKLSIEGAAALNAGLAHLRAGTLPAAQIQAEQGVNYAHKLDKREASLDFTKTAVELERQVRAFLPFPIAQAIIAGETVQILTAQAQPLSNPEAQAFAQLGQVVAANKQGIDLRCSAGVLRVTQLKRAGGKVIRAADYLNARAELKS
jgi:methionyl-tRNA formyltransferase